MSTTGAITDQIMRDINETEQTKYRPINMAGVSKAFKIVVGEHFWSSTMLAFEPADADVVASLQPIILPANLKRIRSVRDDNYTYYQDFSEGRVPKQAYNWFFDTPLTEPLDEGQATVDDGVTCDQFSKTVTFGASVTLPADIAGEFVRVGAAQDLYEIATRDSDTQLTLVEYFRAKRQENASWEIRPRFTKRMKLIDGSRTLVSPSNLRIVYQAEPLELTSDDHPVPIPNDATPVYIKGLQLAMKRKGWNRLADAQQDDYIHALGLAKREDPVSKDRLKPLAMFRRPRNTVTDGLFSSIKRGP